MSFNDALVKEFDAKACVEICDPLKFIQRWQRALPPEAVVTSGAVGDYQKYVCRMVSYYRGHDLPGNVWAIPDLITTTWYSLSGPAGLPRDIVMKLNTAVNNAIALPEVQKRLETEMVQTKTMTPEELTAYMQSQIALWAPTARRITEHEQK